MVSALKEWVLNDIANEQGVEIERIEGDDDDAVVIAADGTKYVQVEGMLLSFDQPE